MREGDGVGFEQELTLGWASEVNLTDTQDHQELPRPGGSSATAKPIAFPFPAIN